jgi:hypothetical protein
VLSGSLLACRLISSEPRSPTQPGSHKDLNAKRARPPDADMQGAPRGR